MLLFLIRVIDFSMDPYCTTNFDCLKHVTRNNPLCVVWFKETSAATCHYPCVMNGCSLSVHFMPMCVDYRCSALSTTPSTTTSTSTPTPPSMTTLGPWTI